MKLLPEGFFTEKHQSQYSMKWTNKIDHYQGQNYCDKFTSFSHLKSRLLTTGL